MYDKKLCFSLFILGVLDYLLFYTPDGYVNYTVFGLLLITLVYVIIKLKNVFPYKVNYVKVALIVLMLLMISVLFSFFYNSLMGESTFRNSQYLSDAVNPTKIKTWLVMSITWLVAGIGEELLFRFCFYSSDKKYQIINGLVSSTIFGLLHQPTNYLGFLYFFTVGCIFYIIYVKSRNIWYCILPHALFNFIGLPVMYIISLIF